MALVPVSPLDISDAGVGVEFIDTHRNATIRVVMTGAGSPRNHLHFAVERLEGQTGDGSPRWVAVHAEYWPIYIAMASFALAANAAKK